MTAVVKYKDPANGLWYKLNNEFAPVICAALSTVDIPILTGPLVVDGYQTKVEDYILLTAQAEVMHNGLWQVTSGNWIWQTEQPGLGGLIYIGNGNVHARTHWVCEKVAPTPKFISLYVALSLAEGANTLNDIEDVDTNGVRDSDVLTYFNGMWVPAPAGGIPNAPVTPPTGYVPKEGDLRLHTITRLLQSYVGDNWINVSMAVPYLDVQARLSAPQAIEESELQRGSIVYDKSRKAYFLYAPPEIGDSPPSDYPVFQRLTYTATIDPANPNLGTPAPIDLLESIYNNPASTIDNRVAEYSNMVVINHDWNTQDYIIQTFETSTGNSIDAMVERSPNVVQVYLKSLGPPPTEVRVILTRPL